MASKYKAKLENSRDQESRSDADEHQLFRQAMAGIKPLKNDEIEPLSARQKVNRKRHKQQKQAIKQVQDVVNDTFSDNFEGYLGDDKINYIIVILQKIWKKDGMVDGDEDVQLRELITSYYQHVNKNNEFPDYVRPKSVLKFLNQVLNS